MPMLEIERATLDALVAAAREQRTDDVNLIYESVLLENGVQIYKLYVRYVEMQDQPQYVGPLRGEMTWPNFQKYIIQLERPICRDDVDTVLREVAGNPHDVHVTTDPLGNVGWTQLEEFQFL